MPLLRDDIPREERVDIDMPTGRVRVFQESSTKLLGEKDVSYF